MTPPDLIARYESLSTPVVFDILDRLGVPDQAVACEVRPLDPGMRVVGPAFTVRGEECRGADNGEAGYRMFREILPGTVLVMAQYGHRESGPWGENASISARMKGAKGLVTDGRVRDAAAVCVVALLRRGLGDACGLQLLHHARVGRAVLGRRERGPIQSFGPEPLARATEQPKEVVVGVEHAVVIGARVQIKPAQSKLAALHVWIAHPNACEIAAVIAQRGKVILVVLDSLVPAPGQVDADDEIWIA